MPEPVGVFVTQAFQEPRLEYKDWPFRLDERSGISIPATRSSFPSCSRVFDSDSDTVHNLGRALVVSHQRPHVQCS